MDPDANNVASLNQQISDLRRQLAETQARALLNGPMAAVQNSGGNAGEQSKFWVLCCWVVEKVIGGNLSLLQMPRVNGMLF